ncbi:hypothetical protein ACWDV4_11705 [Micromonospora sp. NPDC003197]
MSLEPLVLTVDLLLDSALAEEPVDRPYAVTTLLPYLGQSQLERVWALGMDTTMQVQRARVFRELVDYLDASAWG